MSGSRNPILRWGWSSLLFPVWAAAHPIGDREFDGHRGGEPPRMESDDRYREMREEQKRRQEDYHHRMDEALADRQSRLEDWKADQEAYKEKMKSLVESFRERIRNAEDNEKERLKVWLRDAIRDLQRELRNRHAESVKSRRLPSGGEDGPDPNAGDEAAFRNPPPLEEGSRGPRARDSKLTDDQIETIRAKWKAYLSEKEAGAN